MKKQTIFFNGKYVKADKRFLEQIKPGVLDVDGVFETMAIYDGKIFLPEKHWERFKRGLDVFKIRSSYSTKKLMEVCQSLIKRNKIKRGRIRVAVYRDKKITTAIVAKTVSKKTNSEYQKGYKAIISSVVRKSVRYSHVKSHHWNLFYEALLEARARNCDEAILLNSQKQIVEGSMTNVFFIKGNNLMTPAVFCGCLNGIIRNEVLGIARKLGLKVKVGQFKIPQLLKADEVFVTNSILPIMPVVRIDRDKIGRGKMGPKTAMILNEYWAQIPSK